ncbi:MAG: hypothetical protein KF764_19895 [Labilithrix sp.]|nr:hypothetical protein [Labilithrix sp.]
MSEVSGIGARRHFSAEEEEALRRDESTSSIVKRDAKTNVEIYGTDRSWVATKHHQQSPCHDPVASALEIGHAGVEGLEIAGLVHLGVAGAVGGPLVGLALGTYTLAEAHVKADEQARALAKDNAHVALIGALDLPTSYKAARLDGEYKHVARGANTPAFKMTEAVLADKKGRATLQLHADRGMHAARDLTRSGVTAEQYLKQHPKIADTYARDAAFREGFDAYLHAAAALAPAEMKAFEAKIAERDGWYAQSQISFRV